MVRSMVSASTSLSIIRGMVSMSNHLSNHRGNDSESSGNDKAIEGEKKWQLIRLLMLMQQFKNWS